MLLSSILLSQIKLPNKVRKNHTQGRQTSSNGQNQKERAGHVSNVSLCTCFYQKKNISDLKKGEGRCTKSRVLCCFISLACMKHVAITTSSDKYGLDSPFVSTLSLHFNHSVQCVLSEGGWKALYTYHIVFDSHRGIFHQPAEFHIT